MISSPWEPTDRKAVKEKTPTLSVGNNHVITCDHYYPIRRASCRAFDLTLRFGVHHHSKRVHIFRSFRADVGYYAKGPYSITAAGNEKADIPQGTMASISKRAGSDDKL